MRSIFAIFFLCIFSSILAIEQEKLNPSDIERIMDQILSQHVEKREVTEKILKNSIAVFVNQFDSHRMYLLQSEVDPFADLTLHDLGQIEEQYKKKQFTVFQKMNNLFQKAIERSRLLRSQVDKKTKEKFFQQNAQAPKPINEERMFAENEEELRQRLLANLEEFVYSQKLRFGEAAAAQKKSYILANYESKLREFENQYLYQNEEGEPLSAKDTDNLFAIHVLKALASSLDSHTSFYQANEAYDMRVRLRKEFQGIGLVLRDKGNEVVVARMLEGSPAAKSGLIEPGDKLLEVNGKSVVDYPFDKVMELLHDESDNSVRLLFMRKDQEGNEKILNVQLNRTEIIVSTDRVDVSSEPFGNGLIGKITLHSFYQGEGISSEKDVQEAIEKLKSEGNLRGLILDLRENSGGFLSQAVKVAGLFITNGIIVISKYSNGDERFYRDVDSKVAFDEPLVVLTSKATASAAEIVAQALQDYGAAIIVGDEHTYGKGTIQTQTVTDDKSTSYFKVTVGKYYTVSGKTPQKNGVKSDIVVPGKWSKEHIGEIYLDTVEADTIPSTYEDRLSDISPDVKSWYMKYYTPTVQAKVTTWENLLPTLRKNSEYRLSNNKNYQLFLTGKLPDEDKEEEEELLLSDKKPKTYGVDDLQMTEAVNIVKDMVILHSLEGKK
ncbi:MAG: S41 family peptidase [Parachlamydia sp.]|jgi:carboxyl-terminal processing protease|nr:S41 family peptidase [Parachlamydia sp.]